MIKKEGKEKNQESTKRDFSKYKRRLFKEMKENSEDALRKTLSIKNSGPQSDIIELDPGASSKWRQIIRQFENFSKYDHKTITSYIEDNPVNIQAKCNMAIDFYGSPIQRKGKLAKNEVVHSSSLGNREELKKMPVKDDLLKVFVIAFMFVSNRLTTLAIPCTNEAVTLDRRTSLLELVNQMKILNDFLLFILPSKQSQATLLQYETALVSFVGEKIGEMQEKLSNMTFPLDPSIMAAIFFYHFETLTILTSYNAGKKFMKDAADDGIKFAYEIFERSLITSLSSSLFEEIYSSLIQSTEEWEKMSSHPCLFIAIKYNRRKFQYLHRMNCTSDLSELKTKPIQFTLTYINLYYASKIAQIMMDREIFRNEERAMGTLTALLKRNLTILTDSCFTTNGLKVLSKTDQTFTEAILNENCLCLKFIKHILMMVDNPLGIIEKLSLANTLKSLLSAHLVVAIVHGFVITHNSNEYSINSQDFLATAFATLYKLKHLRVTASGTSGVKLMKKSQVHLIILMDEIVMEAVCSATSYLASIQSKLGQLRELLVEYFADEKFSVIEKFREFLHKLYSCPIFRYTAPESLDPIKLQESAQNLVNSKSMKSLLKALAKTIRQDRKTIIPTFQKLISQIIASEDNTVCFGLLKLLYCILTGEAYDDLIFYQILFLNQKPQMTDDNEISLKTKEGNQNIIQEFIESKGLYSLLIELLKLYKLRPETQPKLIAQGILLLLRIQDMCKAFIKNQTEVDQLLKLAMTKNQCHEFVLRAIKICFESFKYKVSIEDTIYLPDHIARTMHKVLINCVDNEELTALCFPFYDALNNFLKYDLTTKALIPYQNHLFHNQSWLLLVALFVAYK